MAKGAGSISQTPYAKGQKRTKTLSKQLSAKAQGTKTRDTVLSIQRAQGPGSAAEKAIRNSVNARRRALVKAGQGNRVAAFNRGLAGG